MPDRPDPESIPAFYWEAHTSRRMDKMGLVEHSCPCGVGHPNPGSALWIAEEIARDREASGDWDATEDSVEELRDAYMVHGCCGCCAASTFPDTEAALVHAHGLIRELQARYREMEDRLADLTPIQARCKECDSTFITFEDRPG